MKSFILIMTIAILMLIYQKTDWIDEYINIYDNTVEEIIKNKNDLKGYIKKRITKNEIEEINENRPKNNKTWNKKENSNFYKKNNVIIKNERNQDAMIRFININNNKIISEMYVRKKENATIALKSGKFKIYVYHGKDWHNKKVLFGKYRTSKDENKEIYELKNNYINKNIENEMTQNQNFNRLTITLLKIERENKSNFGIIRAGRK